MFDSISVPEGRLMFVVNLITAARRAPESGAWKGQTLQEPGR